MFQLPTHSDRKYIGKYPSRINSLGYSNSLSQMVIGAFLHIGYPVHFELNDGRRLIASRSEICMESACIGVELSTILKDPVTPIESLSQERYDEMMGLVRKARGQS